LVGEEKNKSVNDNDLENIENEDKIKDEEEEN